LRVYADTSFLVSLYSPDANSKRAAVRMARLRGVAALTPIGELELMNALELRVFRKEATAAEIKRAQSQLREHIQSGVFELEAVPPTIYERAKQISQKRTSSIGLRTLDILHVASALLLHAEEFWTFDKRQANAARAEGLHTA
jgi:predicted nucleic acid-binding protein